MNQPGTLDLATFDRSIPLKAVAGATQDMIQVIAPLPAE